MPLKRPARQKRAKIILPEQPGPAATPPSERTSGVSPAHPALTLESLQAQQTALLRQNQTLAGELQAMRGQLDATVKGLRQQLNQTRALAVECTVAEQRERRNIAHVCREELQQLLAAMKVKARVFEQQCGLSADPRWRDLADLLDMALRFSQTIGGTLAPHVLHGDDLFSALQWLAVWMREQYAFTIELAAPPVKTTIPEPTSLLLFHAVRHLIVNAAKHSQVKTAQVALLREDGWLRLTVSDDGVGFDPSTFTAPTGNGRLGLASVQQMLDYLGGKLEIDSAPGQGSRLTLTVPFTPAAPAA